MPMMSGANNQVPDALCQLVPAPIASGPAGPRRERCIRVSIELARAPGPGPARRWARARPGYRAQTVPGCQAQPTHTHTPPTPTPTHWHPPTHLRTRT